MLFPFSIHRPTDNLENPGDIIDRHFADRTQRLSAGLAIGSDFRSVVGTLLITRGRGKYLRVNHARCIETPIAESTAAECRRMLRAEAANEVVASSRLTQIGYDLANFQAMAAEKLKTQAGKYVDRLLTVAVSDPGFWTTDFDGQAFYTSLCDGNRLAELSGLTVIDSFPSRDLAVGGNGRSLEALPLWLLLADRNSRVARHHIGVFNIGPTTEIFVLPPSDGLDAEVPPIRYEQAPGTDLIRLLINEFQPLPVPQNQAVRDPVDISKLYVNGKRHLPLIAAWRRLVGESWQASLTGSSAANEPEFASRFDARFVQIAREFQVGEQLSLATLLRSVVALIVESIQGRINRLDHKIDLSNRVHLDRVWISATAEFEACLINQVQQSFSKSEIKSTADLGISGGTSAIVAAILGLMYIDQMPANIPWITGASAQRILGRLTPGRPSVWRQLLMDMADFHPPAMKLSDAV
jgi:1,6-anhydro-N-acetylmuramate kinase